jgi:hypothetical protein
MTLSDRDEVREFIAQTRELRRSEQPPAELFATLLSRLTREERVRESLPSVGLPQRFALSSPWIGAPGRLRRLTSAPLGFALVLALALSAGWRTLRPAALAGPAASDVALGPERATRSAAGTSTLATSRGTGAGDSSSAMAQARTTADVGAKLVDKPAGPPPPTCKPPWSFDAQGT